MRDKSLRWEMGGENRGRSGHRYLFCWELNFAWCVSAYGLAMMDRKRQNLGYQGLGNTVLNHTRPWCLAS
jgi:hypothetical protein